MTQDAALNKLQTSTEHYMRELNKLERQLLNANKTIKEVKAEADESRRHAKSSNERYISLTDDLKRDLEMHKDGMQASTDALKHANAQLQTELTEEIIRYQKTLEEHKVALAQKTQELDLFHSENSMLQAELTQRMAANFKLQEEHQLTLSAKDEEIKSREQELHSKEASR